MGGRDQSKIRVLFLLSSEWAEASAFQHPQQFGLQSHGHVADLIQEQGAAIRLRQQAFLGSVGTGKRTLGMAKSSLSSNESGMAAQLTTTKGPSARSENR